jgi:dTDP-4-dehydrorhamnose reductase
MRILILGGGGMLGHKLVQSLRDEFDTWTTLRGSAAAYDRYGLLESRRVIERVDVENFSNVVDAMTAVRPDALINCIGLIKQLPSASDPILNLRINSLLPHQLHQLCRSSGARLIHFSTDCVFNGRKGMYTEQDPSDAEDLYGRTKFLGETAGPGALTIRSSVIGRELSTSSGLVEWFLSQPGPLVRGYTRAIYSGFTTQWMARIVRLVLLQHPELCGTVQVSSAPINKYDLLSLVRTAYRTAVRLEPVDDVSIDRTLDSTRFRQLTGFIPPSWAEMIEEMAADPTPYDEWKRSPSHQAQVNVRK